MSPRETLWRLHDTMAAPHTPGCAICGDDDEFSPNVEAFERSGKLICDACADDEETFDEEEIAAGQWVAERTEKHL